MKTDKERLEAADAFELAFPEVCEITLCVKRPHKKDRYVTATRAVPGRWWIEGQIGSQTTLVDCLAEILDLED